MTVRAVLFDLDGTLYQDGALIAGAADAVAACRAASLGVRFVTNTTSRSRSSVVDALAVLGVEAETGDVVSPPALAGARLRADGQSAALFVPSSAHADFEGVVRSDAPDWVVVGDLGEAWDFETLNRAFRLLLGGARLLALGRTRYWRAPDGLRLDTGPFVAALEAATGQTAVTLGKPAAAFFEGACAGLGVEPADAIVVGDDAETDVRAAQRAGLLGALVRTGKFRPADLDAEPAPDLVLDSVADLPGALGL